MINQSLRKEKDQFINLLCKEIEQHKTNQEPRFLFKKVAALSRILNPDTYLQKMKMV